LATEEEMKNAKTDPVTGYVYKNQPSFTLALNNYGIADLYPNLGSNNNYGISYMPKTNNYYF
jgi:hypothetical protein